MILNYSTYLTNQTNTNINSTNSSNYTTIIPSNVSNKMDYVGILFIISCGIIFIAILVFSTICQNCKKSSCCIKKNVYYFDKFNNIEENDYYKKLDYNSNPTMNKVLKAKIITCDV